MAKNQGNASRFFRPRPQGLINYLSGLDGLPVAEIEQQLNELYSVDCCDHHIALPNLAAEDDFAAQMLAMLQQVWKDKGMPEGLINKEVTSQFAKHLWGGVTEGYGSKAKEFNAGKIDWDTPDANMLTALQKNVWAFSASKNYTQMRELSNALIGDDKKLRTFREFKEVAFAINDKHSNQWLKSEYDLAVAGGQMAGKWVEIEKNIDTLPLLEFDAVMDSRTTPICSPLNGVLLPVNDPFWSKYYPPNHWGCRSTVRQRAGGIVTPHHQLPHADIPPMFQTNLAQAGLIFPKGSAYFIDTPKDVLKAAEALRVDPNYAVRIQGKKGGYVDIHSLTDQNKKQEHIEASKVLADKGNQIKLTPEINIRETEKRRLFYPELAATNASNPDARFNGILGDYKIPDNAFVKQSNITDAIRKTAQKDVSICCISLLNRDYKMKEILGGVRGALKQKNVNASIKEVWIICNDKSVLKIPRGIAARNDFYKIAFEL